MSLSIAIVGLPNVGKSTLFNALTNAGALAANYPFATIEPNTGIVPVPDTRLARLEEMYHAQKVIPATVTFVDIAGLVAGASKGEGLGNQFLANIRECNAIVHVVRAFVNTDIVHVSDNVSPVDDIDVINTELCLADIQTIDNRRLTLEKQAKANPKLRDDLETLNEARELLDQGIVLNTHPSIVQRLSSIVQLLTAKPVIYAFNIDEETLTDETKKQALANLVLNQSKNNASVDAAQGSGEQRNESYKEVRRASSGTDDAAMRHDSVVFICAKLEEELSGLDEAEARELLESYGVQQSGLHQLIRAAYSTLGLQSYLTAGEKEVRAWTIHQGATAPQAAGVIHGDFERGFIAASIVDYDDLMTAGSEQAAKAAGKMRTEGRDYIMRPGDIVEFRFNVTR